MISFQEVIRYRIRRANETLNDAIFLAKEKRWNSCINRLYYASYYAVSALLLSENQNPSTHSGVKQLFSELFIKTSIISEDFGKMHSQLFSWRQKGDYDDLFDFDSEKVIPYLSPVQSFIKLVEEILKKNLEP